MELLNSLAVANWFIDMAKAEGQKITAMRAQKLVYLTHAWCLALTDRPLVNEKVVALPWGPAFRDGITVGKWRYNLTSQEYN
jgi:uncharacterized phage-associated protein